MNKINTWFVTGASSGVGHEIAKQLLDRGYNVIATSRRVPDFIHEKVLCLSVDVTDKESVKDAVEKSLERFGNIDVLCNNAGIGSNIILEEENLFHMKEVFETNFFGTFNTMNTLIPHFRKNKNGTIINNISMSGLSIRYGGSAYCSSKHALEGLTGVCWHETKSFCRVMALELGYFPETDILKNSKIIKTSISEYQNCTDNPINQNLNASCDLKKAVNVLINTIEQEKIPRRLIIGEDAFLKMDFEMNSIKEDLLFSKKLLKQCTKKLLIPPAPYCPGSLGDKAILLSINTKDTDLAVADTSSDFWQNLNFNNIVDINNLDINKYDEVHFYPTDVIDGAFGSSPLQVFESVTNLFKNTQAKIFVNSFSYGSSPIKESLEYIKSTNAIYSLRDEYSLQRFKNFFPNHISFLQPDPAFDLEIREPKKEMLLPNNPVAICPANHEYDKYCKIVERCIKKEYDPVLILHDLRPMVGDIKLCDELSKNYTLPIVSTEDPREIKYYLSKMNFVITGRMHVAILSMGTDTKVYGFDYNNKMKGTFKVKNQEHNVIKDIEEIYEIQ